MKKFIISVLLTLTIVFSTINLTAFDFNNTEVASAATKNNIMASAPTLKASSRTATTVNLNIGKISGVAGYKVYRASSEEGSYNYIGYTKTVNYKDTRLINTKSYFYKVRAYKYIDDTKVNSKYSRKVVVIPTFNYIYAAQVLILLNQERAKDGLLKLTMDKELMHPANKRVVESAELFSHTRPNGTAWSTVLDDYNISVYRAGENLAYGYATPVAVVEGWMNSPGHRANIMNDEYAKIGIGVYKDSKGTVYCSQLFTD